MNPSQTRTPAALTAPCQYINYSRVHKAVAVPTVKSGPSRMKEGQTALR